MKYLITINGSMLTTVPTMKKTEKFHTNGWISPKGDFYGFDRSLHLAAARYISIFILNKDLSALKPPSQFFKDGFDSYLKRNKWLEVKDLYWIGNGTDGLKIFGNPNQKQLDTLFDYCEFFKIDFNKLIGKEEDKL
jgi:hypothetical protein